MIRAALPTESGILAEPAFRSKAPWGYSEGFLETCRTELLQLACGAERSGSRPSASMPDHPLPLLEIELGQRKGEGCGGPLAACNDHMEDPR